MLVAPDAPHAEDAGRHGPDADDRLEAALGKPGREREPHRRDRQSRAAVEHEPRPGRPHRDLLAMAPPEHEEHVRDRHQEEDLEELEDHDQTEAELEDGDRGRDQNEDPERAQAGADVQLDSGQVGANRERRGDERGTREPRQSTRGHRRRVDPGREDGKQGEGAVERVELVGRRAPVGEQQEPQRHLGDDERLCERQDVRVDAPRRALSPQVDQAPPGGEAVGDDQQDGVECVELAHRSQPTIRVRGRGGKAGARFRARERHRRGGSPLPPQGADGRPLLLSAGRHPGCTKQACSLRDAYGEIQERGATVLGVSPDTEASHVKFKAKYELPFTLLADPEHEVAELYGVWVEKNNYGKKSMGIKRSTFVIDGDGNVVKAMRGVSPDDHADVVLDALPG